MSQKPPFEGLHSFFSDSSLIFQNSQPYNIILTKHHFSKHVLLVFFRHSYFFFIKRCNMLKLFLALIWQRPIFLIVIYNGKYLNIQFIPITTTQNLISMTLIVMVPIMVPLMMRVCVYVCVRYCVCICLYACVCFVCGWPGVTLDTTRTQRGPNQCIDQLKIGSPVLTGRYTYILKEQN